MLFNIRYLSLIPAIALMGVHIVIAQVPANYTGKAYKDSATIIPGTLKPERYDVGANNVTYFDNTAGHTGAVNLRNPTDVDLDDVKKADPNVDTSKVKAVVGSPYWGWLANGEWLKFTVDVKTAGTYNISAMVGVNSKNKSFRLDAYQGTDSVSSGSLIMPYSGTCNGAACSCPYECYHYWYYAANLGTIKLKAGIQVMKLQMVNADNNINYVDLKLADGTPVLPNSLKPQSSTILDAKYDVNGKVIPTSIYTREPKTISFPASK